MQGFIAWQGDAAITQEIVVASLEEGVLFQTAGSDPMKIRLLPPLTLTDEELEAGFAALERALRRVAERHGLALESAGTVGAKQARECQT
jgi:acetylornithine/succinyldiaminopimelate/putrescine aminotransferase